MGEVRKDALRDAPVPDPVVNQLLEWFTGFSHGPFAYNGSQGFPMVLLSIMVRRVFPWSFCL